MNKHTSSLKDYAYKYILDKISDGNIAPGEKLNEHNISTELDVSRTPVREALYSLNMMVCLKNRLNAVM
ncbi:MAG: GntR family transcriptional regulator [Anaerovoracaceae bacterium]